MDNTLLPEPSLAKALEQTRTVIDDRRPWYEALVLRTQAARANAGDTSVATVSEIVDGFSFLVNAVNVDLLKPVCFGLQELFAAVQGAAAAREELIDLLGYCVSITSIVLNHALLADLPEHVKRALMDVEAEIKAINGNARLFDAKTGCSLPCRRLRLHAKDREEIQEHKVRLQEILDLATTAAVFDTNVAVRQTQAELAAIRQGPSAPDMARVPTSAPPLPKCYVPRTSLVDGVVMLTMSADNLAIPHALFGMGGSGKTVLASAVVLDDRIRKYFRRGVFWINVGQSSDLVDLLQRLAARMMVDPAGPVKFNSEDEGIQRLTSWIRRDPQPRLVVLDDVWEPDIVNALRHTGLTLLATTRIRDVVIEEGRCTEVGVLTNAEARDLLLKQSGAVDVPEAEGRKVAEECGWLALTVAIAGSLPSIRRSPNGVEAWRSLHLEIAEKKRQRRGLRMANDITSDRSKSTMFPVLGLSMDQLGEDARTLFFNLVVLARGVPAPVDMLTNLWERKDDLGTVKEADFLASRSLLQKEQGGGYILHDLMLDFIRVECDSGEMKVFVKGTVERQRQYLGRLAVLRRYFDVGENSLDKGLYALSSLWRSLEELSSGADRMMSVTYTASLNEMGQTATENAVPAYFAVARILSQTGKFAEAESVYERCLPMVEELLGPEHPGVSTVLGNRADMFRAQGKYAEAEALYERGQAIDEKVLGPEHPLLATTLNNRANLLMNQGKYAEANPLFRRAVEIGEKSLGPEHPGLAIFLTSWGQLLFKLGMYAEAAPLYERCQAIQEKALGPEHPTLAVTLQNRGELFNNQGKFSEAEPLFERSLAIREKALGPNHPDLAMALNGLGSLLYNQGKYDRADAYSARAIDIGEKSLGPDHPDLAGWIGNRATVLRCLGKDAEAGTLFERCQAMLEKSLGPEHPKLAMCLNGRAVLLGSQGKCAEAEPLYERCQAIQERTLGPDHPTLAITIHNRAALLGQQGKYAEAETLYKRCQAMQEKALGPDHPNLAMTFNTHAELFQIQGKHAEADRLYVRAIAIAEASLGPDHPDLATYLVKRARLLESQGKATEAAPLFERYRAIRETSLGPEHPELAVMLGERARHLITEGKYSAAVPLLERALAITTKVWGKDNENTIATAQCLEMVQQLQALHGRR